MTMIQVMQKLIQTLKWTQVQMMKGCIRLVDKLDAALAASQLHCQ